MHIRCNEFVRGVIDITRKQAVEVWEISKEVKGRESMAKLEQACSELGKEAGSEALRMGLQCIEGRRRQEICPKCKSHLDKSKRLRTYTTLVGYVRGQRWYYYCRRCAKSWAPLDELIAGQGSGISFGLQEKICQLSSEMSYEQTSKKLKSLCGLRVSATAVKEYTIRWSKLTRTHRTRGEGWSEQANLSMDAGKVNTVKNGWRDMKIAVFEQEQTQGRCYCAEIGSSKKWGLTLRGLAGSLGIGRTERMGIWGDGAAWIWKLANVNFAGAKCIVDFYHVMENLSEYAKKTFGEGSSEAQEWLDRIGHKLKNEGGRGVYDEIEAARARRRRHRQARKKILKYLKGVLDYTEYPQYLADGLGIGSGIVESACKRIIGARLKRGSRWREENAISMASMRGLFLADEWDNFWKKQLKCA